jgi:hypothetical protein
MCFSAGAGFEGAPQNRSLNRMTQDESGATCNNVFSDQARSLMSVQIVPAASQPEKLSY